MSRWRDIVARPRVLKALVEVVRLVVIVSAVLLLGPAQSDGLLAAVLESLKPYVW